MLSRPRVCNAPGTQTQTFPTWGAENSPGGTVPMGWGGRGWETPGLRRIKEPNVPNSPQKSWRGAYIGLISTVSDPCKRLQRLHRGWWGVVVFFF